MKNLIIAITIVIIGIGGLVWWGKSNQLVTVNNSSDEKLENHIGGMLTAEETMYDFGEISMKNGKVSKVFKVTNLTENDINLKTIATSCMCTVAYIINGDSKEGPFGMEGMGNNKTDDVIKVGDSRDIEVIFDPNAHGPAGVGSIDRIIVLTDTSGNEINLRVKGVVTP